MTLLIDTHSFLWFVEGSLQLSSRARRLIEDARNDRFLSVASVWEMAIKVGIGKLNLGQPIETFIPHQLSLNGIDLLGIALSHAAAVARLPMHHRDPFDRMLVAQAQVEQMPIVSNDPALDAYAVTRLW
jgi:PIN domain nuclease of toxin-antitoxin system